MKPLDVADWPICCKTRKLQRQEFFSKTRSARRSPILCTLNRGAEIARSLTRRGSVPSRLYAEDAPTARRIFDRLCKTTFATQSAQSVISLPRGNSLAFGLMRTLGWIL